MIAAQNKSVAFIILLAGQGITGEKILLMQSQLIGKANGASKEELKVSNKLNKQIYTLLKEEQDTSILKQKIRTLSANEINKQKASSKIPEKQLNDLVNKQTTTLISPWFRYFLSYNPSDNLNKVTCPLSALFGSKDLQVAPKENKKAIKKALKKAHNKDYKIVIIPNLNHLFQECKTGSPAEYAQIEQTFSPIALKKISDWIKK